MRRTGRTTRIVNFAIDQLLSCGNVVIADHAIFEGHEKANHLLIDKVYEHWNMIHHRDHDQLILRYREHQLGPNEALPGTRLKAVQFYLIHKSNDTRKIIRDL